MIGYFQHGSPREHKSGRHDRRRRAGDGAGVGHHVRAPVPRHRDRGLLGPRLALTALRLLGVGRADSEVRPVNEP